MNAKAKHGPRKYIKVGRSYPWRPNLVRLQAPWQKGRLVLCLGAGVSIPYGLPNWEDLLLSLLLRLPPSTDTRGSDDTDGWHQYFPHYRRALGQWMMEYFKFDPVELARVFVDDEKLRSNIRAELYAPLAKLGPAVPRRTSLDAVVALIADAKRAANPVPAVITLNYDDLLETKLEAAGVQSTPVFGPNAKVVGIPIYHVHGYLPRAGEIPKQDLVFTESTYHQISSSGFHWSVKTIMRHLHTHSVLFVGVSMNDPNLRRFLDMAYTEGEDPRHFATREDYSVEEEALDGAMEQIEKRAKKAAKEMGRDETKTPPQLRAAVKDVCEKAHEYDKQTLRSLGVRPIWVRDNSDIPSILDLIRTRIPDA